MGRRGKEVQRTKTEVGQTVVEFSLVIGLLLLIVFGIVEFSRLFFAYGSMSHGVREGARYAIVQRVQDPTDPDEVDALTNRIQETAESRMILIGGTVSVSVEYPDIDRLVDEGDPNREYYRFCPHYCSVLVRAVSTYQPWIPLVPEFEMVAQSKMHFE